MREPLLVLGIGNPDRGDDGAGRAVARALRETAPDGMRIVEHDGEASGLVAVLAEVTAAVIVDASASGAAPGTVRRFDVAAAPLPADGTRMSSHGLGLVEAVELARVLGQLPQHCIVYAIEGADFRLGAPLSPPVAAAVRRVAADLCAEALAAA